MTAIGILMYHLQDCRRLQFNKNICVLHAADTSSFDILLRLWRTILLRCFLCLGFCWLFTVPLVHGVNINRFFVYRRIIHIQILPLTFFFSTKKLLLFSTLLNSIRLCSSINTKSNIKRLFVCGNDENCFGNSLKRIRLTVVLQR